MADTVGSLIDKLTIVELKIYHMTEHRRQLVARPEYTLRNEEIAVSGGRIVALCRQRDALVAEFTELAAHPPKPFPQFKMYNDPQYRTT